MNILADLVLNAQVALSIVLPVAIAWAMVNFIKNV